MTKAKDLQPGRRVVVEGQEFEVESVHTEDGQTAVRVLGRAAPIVTYDHVEWEDAP